MSDTHCLEEDRLDVVGAPLRPMENFTHTAPADDEFTADPLTIADQAEWTEVLTYGPEDAPEDRFYVLYRSVRINAPGGWACNYDGRRWGTHMVAYRADEKGRVLSWESRFEIEGPSIKVARAKFEFLWSNDLLDQFWQAVEPGFEFEDEQRPQI